MLREVSPELSCGRLPHPSGSLGGKTPLAAPAATILDAGDAEADGRDAAMKFALNLGAVDAVSIGFKSIREIDEALDRINFALNARSATGPVKLQNWPGFQV